MVDVDCSEREHTADYSFALVQPAAAPIEIRARALKEMYDALIADSRLLDAILRDQVRMELNDFDLRAETDFDDVLGKLVERVRKPAARHWLRQSWAGDNFVDDTQAICECLTSELVVVAIEDLGDAPEPAPPAS